MPHSTKHDATTPDAPPLTVLAAERLQQIAHDDLSSEVRDKAVLCLIDAMGAAYSGSTLAWSEQAAQYAISRRGAAEEARVFGHPFRTSAETAAFANSVATHGAVRDDMHLESCAHIGSMVVPAVTAVAQRDRWTGEQLVRGIVGGYEMGALLGTSIRRGGQFNPHVRASGLIGAFAAAAALVTGAASDAKVAQNALSLAINMACGLNQWAHTGASEIYFQNGTASRAGITSYDLAGVGVQSSDSVLEGKDGLFAALGVGSAGAVVFREWLQRNQDPGTGILDVKFKPAAACNFTQSSSALALRLAGQLTPDQLQQIEGIAITTTTAATQYPGCDYAEPLTCLGQSMMSIQYGVCAALVHRSIGVEALAKINDPAVRALMAKCSLQTVPQYDLAFTKGRQPARIRIRLAGNAELEDEAADVPWMLREEVLDRFVREALPTGDGAKQLEALLGIAQAKDCRAVL